MSRNYGLRRQITSDTIDKGQPTPRQLMWLAALISIIIGLIVFLVRL